MDRNTGEVVQVIGPVVDIRFTELLPKLYNAVVIPFGEAYAVSPPGTCIQRVDEDYDILYYARAGQPSPYPKRHSDN